MHILAQRLTIFITVVSVCVLALPGLAQFTSTATWSDEFGYSGSPDPSKWTYDIGGGGWGNNELQFYTSRTNNARVENGSLVINALQENYGGNAYTSARLRSTGEGNWTYGRIVVRSRFTGAAGTWPAIWTLPTDWVYGGWPDSGEMDIMEHVSTHGESVQASIHTRDYNFQIGTARVGFQYGVDYWNWHDYVLEWYPDRLDVSIDNTRYFSFHNEGTGYGTWPFDQRFHLMLNVAVGGWGGSPGFTSETMEIDHVRAYAYTGQSQVTVHPQAWYRLVNRHSGKVLDIDGPSTADGANLHQWQWYDLDSQQWRFEPAGDGSFRMISRYSNKACDVAAAAWTNGTNVQQADLNGSHAQDWWLQPVGDGYCKIVSRETGRVLDVAELSTLDGANVQQWDYAGGANQQWLIDQVVAPPVPPAPTGLQAEAGPEQVTLSWDAGTNTTSYTLKRSPISGGPYVAVATNLPGTSAVDTGLVGGKSYYYVISAMNGTSEGADSAEAAAIPWTRAYAVNSGGLATPPFNADAHVSGGTPASTTAAIDTTGLTDPAPAGVYQSERYGNMTYTLSGLTTGATYRLRLHFAETYWTSAGQRRFNVSVNSAPVLTVFDVLAAAGAKDRALIREFDVAANASGQIVVQFTSVVDNPTLSGLELVQAPMLAPPLLTVNHSGPNLALAWPATATAFNVYRSTNLAEALPWTPVPILPTELGDERTLTLPMTQDQEYFRLSAP